MKYSRAVEILGYTTPKSLKENAELAKTRLSQLTPSSPLRYKVACQLLMDEGNKKECPFCAGSKITPYSGSANQDCGECDKGGMISIKKLKRYDLV